MTLRSRPLLIVCLLWTAVASAQSDGTSTQVRPLEASLRSGTATRDQQLDLARLYLQSNRYYEASKISRALLSANAEDREAIAIRDEAARGLREVNDRAVAAAEARAAAAGASDADRLALADAYFEAGSYGAASDAYDRLGAERLDAEHRLRRARSLSWSGRLDRAESAYAALAAEQASPELELEYGQLLSWMGASRPARERLERAYAAKPSEESVMALANARSWNSDRDGAIALLETYTTSNPGSVEAAKLLAELRTSPELRIERLDRMIESEPHNLALRVERARLLVDAGRNSEALRELAFVRDHSTSRVEGVDELERRAREARASELAAIEMRRGSASTPDEMLSLAKAYTGVEAYDESIEFYDRYLDQRPDDLDARIAYARVLGWDKRWGAAQREYESILRAHPERADLQLEYAQILSYDRAYVPAVRTFRALTDISDNPRAHLYTEVPARAHFNLGQIYRWFGWNDHAVEEQRRALAIDAGYAPSREELDRVRHVRPASRYEARYSYNTDSNDFTLKRVDLTGEVWRSQDTALNLSLGRHNFEHQQASVDANVISAGLTKRFRDRLTARGRVGATFYQDGLGTRPFFGVGAEYLPDLQSRVAVDYNRYDLVYDVFTLSSLTIPTSGGVADLDDPIAIDDFRVHYDYDSGGFWSFLGDASYGFITDDNRRAALHGLLAFRVLRAPFVALKLDGRWLQYDERTNRYWSPTDYNSLAGVLHVGHNFNDRLFWDAELKYGRSWEGERESDLRAISTKLTLPLNDRLDLVGNYGYGKSGRLESAVLGNNGDDFVNYWQRHWYVGVRVKRLFGQGDRESRSPYYYDNNVLAGSPLASQTGGTR